MKNNLNLLLAAIFMIGFLTFWQSFVMKRYNTAAPVNSTATVTAPSSIGVSTPQKKSGTAVADKPLPVIGTEDKLVVLETPDNKISFLSRGARVASWQIMERDHWIELIEPEKYRTVTPLETYPSVNFLAEKKSDHEVVFIAIGPSGERIVKTFKLSSNPPFHSLSIVVSNPTKNPLSVQFEMPLGNGLDKHEVGTPYDPKGERLVLSETRAVGLAGNIKSWKPGLIFKRTIDMVDPSTFEWVAVDNNHFMMALLPMDGGVSHVRIVGDRDHSPTAYIPFQAKLGAGDSISRNYELYAGAKDYTELKAIGRKLEGVVDFGMFGPIAKALLVSLKFLKKITGNFGWAIVVLTILIQFMILPLTRKNLQHAARMKELQPQLKKLQEQFKNDPKRMQAETFNLYKKNGMKFMGMEGCFPMLLQMPVLFAFYTTLRVAYDLRGAPWILWIHNLGAHDPYYVLPILMAIGMFLQQKMSAATAADPAQAKMMMFMPVMLFFMFRTLPAGFTLYMCVSSATTIIMQRVLGAHKQSTPNPAT